MLFQDFNWEKHDKYLEEMSGVDKPISDVIKGLRRKYKEWFYLSPRKINCGLCEEFAHDVCYLVDGATQYWGDELEQPKDNPDKYGGHNFIYFNGLYYDAEHPNGIKDWRLLKAFNH